MKGNEDRGEWQKNTGFLEKLYFEELEYDADLDYGKENLFSIQNILEKHIGLIEQ